MRNLLCVVMICSSLSLSLSGCRKVETAVEIPAQGTNQVPAVLLSELKNSTESLIHCPIELHNNTDQATTAILTGTGCSCYGITLDGEKIEKGHELTLEANTILKLEIQAQAPRSESNKEYYATFAYSTGEQSEEKKLSCGMAAYRDIKIIPKVLTCETKPGETVELEKEITVERIFRSEDGQSPEPEFHHLPEQVTVMEIKQIEEPTKIEDNLWKSTWSAKLKVQVDGDIPGQGITHNFATSFPATEFAETLASQSKIIRRVRLPVRFPSELHFGKFTLGQSRKRSLFISSTDDELFHLELESKSPNDEISIDVPDKTLSQYRIDITINPQSSGDWRRELTFRTDLSEQPQIVVAVRAKVEPAASED